MNKQIEKAYEERPRNTVYQVTVSAIVLALLIGQDRQWTYPKPVFLEYRLPEIF